MKCKKGKLLILLIVIVSSLSGCFTTDEQKVLNGFDKYGMWDYFPSSFYDLLQDETKNVSYVITWEGESAKCNPEIKESVWIDVNRYTDFGLKLIIKQMKHIVKVKKLEIQKYVMMDFVKYQLQLHMMTK